MPSTQLYGKYICAGPKQTEFWRIFPKRWNYIENVPCVTCKLSFALKIYIPSFKKKGKKKRAIARGKWSSECYSVLWALMASVNDMGCSVVCALLSHPWCNDPSTLMPPQGTMSTSIPHLHLYNYPHLLCAGAAPTVSTAGWFHYQQLCNSVLSVSP